MSEDEINKKVVTDETDAAEGNTAEAAASVNLVDLLKDTGNKIINNTEKDLSGFGSLKIEGLQNKQLERLGEKEIRTMKELPLSRTEQLLLRSAADAVRSGSVQDIQEMLKTLAENPKSVDRVMRALQEQTKWPNSIGWEKGTDSDGKDFVRMRISHQNDSSKSSGRTELTIGSDGRNSATHTDSWRGPEQPLSPEQGLRNVQGYKKYEFLPHHDEREWGNKIIEQGGGKFNPAEGGGKFNPAEGGGKFNPEEGGGKFNPEEGGGKFNPQLEKPQREIPETIRRMNK